MVQQSRQPVTAIAVPATTIELPELMNAEAAAKAAIDTYKGFIGSIDNDDTYRFVGDELVKVKGAYNKYSRDCEALKEAYRESKRVAQNGMNVVDNYFAGVLQLLSAGEKILKTERERWEAIEKRRVQEEQRKQAQAQAVERERVAEENRKRSEAAEAEARRKQDEANALARKRDVESKQKVARLRQEAEEMIVTAAAQNQVDEEIAVISTNATLVQPSLTKTAGISSGNRWTAEFTDVTEVLKGVLDGRIPAKALRGRVDGKMVPLNGNIKVASTIEIPLDWFRKEAEDLHENFDYPGVRAFEKSTTAVRA